MKPSVHFQFKLNSNIIICCLHCRFLLTKHRELGCCCGLACDRDLGRLHMQVLIVTSSLTCRQCGKYLCTCEVTVQHENFLKSLIFMPYSFPTVGSQLLVTQKACQKLRFSTHIQGVLTRTLDNSDTSDLWTTVLGNICLGDYVPTPQCT